MFQIGRNQGRLKRRAAAPGMLFLKKDEEPTGSPTINGERWVLPARQISGVAQAETGTALGAASISRYFGSPAPPRNCCRKETNPGPPTANCEP
jgi:hypothetical protein